MRITVNFADMDFNSIWEEIVHYLFNMPTLEFLGFLFGVLCVLFLIIRHVLTWPFGIAYVLVSLVVFIQQKLYADFTLHVFFLIMNIYGWYYWVYGKKEQQAEVPITSIGASSWLGILVICAIGIVLWGFALNTYTDADLAYWDSTTSVLSFAAMWLTARKKIENWTLWLVVDILATGIYFYKGIYFYCLLYLIYIGMAIAGYMAWKKAMRAQVMAV